MAFKRHLFQALSTIMHNPDENSVTRSFILGGNAVFKIKNIDRASKETITCTIIFSLIIIFLIQLIIIFLIQYTQHYAKVWGENTNV